MKRFLLVPLLLAAPAATPAVAQCSATLTSTVHAISVTRGGAQNLVLTVNPTPLPADSSIYHLVGSFNSTGAPSLYLLEAGINLNLDRYLYATVLGRSQFLSTRITPGGDGYHWIYLDEHGVGMTQAFVEPNIAARYVGRTVYHAAYRRNSLTFLPECGTNLVPLTFTP